MAAIFEHLSLMSGPFVVVVVGAAVLTLLVALVAPARLGRRVVVLVGAVVLDVATALTLHSTGLITDHYPPSFLLWVGGFFVAVLALVTGSGRSANRARGRRGRRWRRAAAVAAVPLWAAAAFVLINDHYAYFPTVGALADEAMPDRVVHVHLTGRTSVQRWAHRLPPVQGRLVAVTIPVPASHLVHRQDSVWLPPAYFDDRRDRLPVVVMLGGTPGSPTTWIEAGDAVTTAAAYAATHDGFAPVLVFTDPNGAMFRDTECVDGPIGRSETFLASDVPHFVTTTLGVPDDPARWAILGFSEGGTCALDVTLRHPDVYRHFADLAGDAAPNLGDRRPTLRKLYGGNAAMMAAHDPLHLLRMAAGTGVSGWFVTGQQDAKHLRITTHLATAARRDGLAVGEVVLAGSHNWRFALLAFRTMLPELSATLGTDPRSIAGNPA